MSSLDSFPRVLICIPAYNAGGTILETITSILGQSYKNIEVHVVDNNSSDNTLTLVASIDDPRIFLHKHTHLVSGEESFTRCMRLASGEYTCIFHADDVYDSSIIERQVRILEEKLEVDVALTQALTIDDSSNVIGHIDLHPSIPDGSYKLFGPTELLKSLLRHGNRIVISSLMIRSKIFQDTVREWGDGTFKSASDVGMYLHLAEYQKILVLGSRLISYRISRFQYSQRNRDRVERPDVFLVLDYYVNKYRDRLGVEDLRNYEQLIWRDKIARCINLTAAKKYLKVSEILYREYSNRILLYAIQSRVDFIAFAAFVLLKLFSALRLLALLRIPIIWIRRL